MKIGAVAALVGVRPSAIRYYESEGLLSSADRVGGKREYGATVAGELRLLLGAQRAGLTLAEIRALLPASRAERSLSESWKAVAEKKLAELRELEAALRATRQFLKRSLACECATSGICEIALAGEIRGGAAKPLRAKTASRARGVPPGRRHSR